MGSPAGVADTLINAVLRAGEHGIGPQTVSRQSAAVAIPPLQRDLVLSDAFLSYADALARGVMRSSAARRPGFDGQRRSTPPPRSTRPSPAPTPRAAIEALPRDATYRLLQQALQPETIAAARKRSSQPRTRNAGCRATCRRTGCGLTLADGRLVLYRDDRPIFSTRVIVGQDDDPIRARSSRPHLRRFVQPALEHPVVHRHRGDPAKTR